MTNNRKVFWLLCLIAVLGIIIYTQATSLRQALSITVGVIGVGGVLGRYVWFFMDARTHVAQQARVDGKASGAVLFGLFKKTLVFIFLPALVITVILVTLATLLS